MTVWTRMPRPSRRWLACLALAAPSLLAAQQTPPSSQQAPPSSQQAPPSNPASRPRPETVTPQAYPAEQVDAGRRLFAAQCGFCHGRDTMGGENGPDLTRSTVVAEDVRGDTIAPIVRTGRTDKGMPAFALSDGDVAAIVAFVHDAKDAAGALTGGRRRVDAEDLTTGDANAGRQYFGRACARCHSATGDLAGVATRHEGLALLQRMLYPTAGRGGGPAPAPPKVTVTLPSGQTVIGSLVFRDEFTITVKDASGWSRSWRTSAVTFTVDDPLQAHVDQLGKYTDEDMHDVLAYLRTLRD
jgi:cytochrome c oxidase cbb3-type subunit 3